MKFKLEIPKLTQNDFCCPCSKFVKSIGSCTCHNIQHERRNDPKGLAMFDEETRRSVVYSRENGVIVMRSRAVKGRLPSSLHELKLNK